MTNSYKCVFCGRYWPFGIDFAVCPCCREPCTDTYVMPKDWDDTPLDVMEAARLKGRYDFGWWLWFSGAMEHATEC